MPQPRFQFPVPPHVAVAAASSSDADVPQIHPEEEATITPTTTPARRVEFCLGRIAARRALEKLGVPPVPVLRGPSREPIWPPGVVGSITHTHEHALAAVALKAKCGGIGLDLEHSSRYFANLSREVADEVETAYLDGLTGTVRERATLELFSAKEAVFKAFFPRVGRFFGFDAAHIDLIDGSSPLLGRLVSGLDPYYPNTRHFEVERRWNGDFVVAFLVLSPD